MTVFLLPAFKGVFNTLFQVCASASNHVGYINDLDITERSAQHYFPAQIQLRAWPD